MGRLGKVLLKAAGWAALLFLIAVLAEGGARLMLPLTQGPIFQAAPGRTPIDTYHPRLMWALKPNFESAHPRILTNSIGLRNAEIAPQGERLRVLCLGDSTTFGTGVGNDEAWPQVLGRLLDERAPGRFQVINAGVPGYTFVQAMLFMEHYGLALSPDIVLVSAGHNDMSLLSKTGGLRDVEFVSPESSASALGVLLKMAARGAGLVDNPVASFEPLRVTPGEMVDAIYRLQKLCEMNEAVCVFLGWPFRSEAIRQERGDMQELLAQAAPLSQALYIDLMPVLSQQPEEDYTDGVHITAAANLRVAEYLAERLHLAVGHLSQEKQDLAQ